MYRLTCIGSARAAQRSCFQYQELGWKVPGASISCVEVEGA